MSETTSPVVTHMVCSVCGVEVALDRALTFVCPNASESDRHHVLGFESRLTPFRPDNDDNPFIAYRRWLAVDAFGAAVGLSDEERVEIIRSLDDKVAVVAGTGFRTTPMARHDVLSDELGFSLSGGVWIKDETHNVAGSHKARHLFTELVYLLMAERAGVAPWSSEHDRPPLAIASCGNAAIAASTLAAAVRWPIRVHVPTFASATVLATLNGLDAQLQVCERRTTDAPGDPCVYRFREAVGDGAIPFGVQGPENVWCLDGGRTLGWEMSQQMEDQGRMLDAVFIQVGGGAFASSVGASFSSTGIHPRLYAVQAEGCAPLARAWERAHATGGAHHAGSRWNECMWPWESEPHSLADGILDDETYDWIGICDAMVATGGSPIVAPESVVVRAHELAHQLTALAVSPTGTAGLAGLLAARDRISDDECVAVVFSGVARD